MVLDIVNGAVGLVVGMLAGLLTGYFFERRATKAAEGENARLRAELSALRESVYTVGADRHHRTQYDHHPLELPEELKTWLHSRQDAEGKVALSRTVAEFMTRGFSQHEVHEALSGLCASGSIERQSSWVRLL
jgi:uncharacterized protein YneF (UPF0154 family)